MERHNRVALTLLALAGAFLFVVAAFAFAARPDRAPGQDTPQLTVRGFLSAAVVNNDGVTACRYLAPRARVSFEGHSPADPTCETFFGGAVLNLGGLTVDSDHDLNELSYRVVADGSARTVTVSHSGQSVSFVLRPADFDEFAAPPTRWRIDSSVAMLDGTPAAAPAPNRHV